LVAVVGVAAVEAEIDRLSPGGLREEGIDIARQSRNQTTAPATYTGAAIVPGKLTIAGLPIDDCCVWRSGTLESSIVNEQIVN